MTLEKHARRIILPAAMPKRQRRMTFFLQRVLAVDKIKSAAFGEKRDYLRVIRRGKAAQ
jgi:hypothetical protein